MTVTDTSEMFLITGIPGSGKTVLFSVLVLRYEDKFFPKNKEAKQFIRDAQCLKQKQWPAATNPMAIKKAMQWDFTHNGKKSRLIISDKAGEAWNTFVEENQEPNLQTNVASIPKVLQKLREKLSPQEKLELENIEFQFQKAACVCIMIDLEDDINNKGKTNFEQRDFITAVMNYLEKIGRKKCPIALVVTKCKSYGNETEWKGIFKEQYLSLVQKHWKGNVKAIYTDAVAETITDADDKMIPATNFASYGLDELLDLIGQQIQITQWIKILKMLVIISIIIFIGWIFKRYIPPLGWIITVLFLVTVVIKTCINPSKNEKAIMYR